jgi:hypothetical protein
MKKEEFIANFVTQFLAAYYANHYENDCLDGHVHKRDKHPPLEDAFFLAQTNWNNLIKFNKNINNIEDIFDVNNS